MGVIAWPCVMFSYANKEFEIEFEFVFVNSTLLGLQDGRDLANDN